MQCIVTTPLVYISVYLILVLRKKNFSFGYLSSGYYLREQECEDPWFFFEAKDGPRAKTFGETGLRGKYRKKYL
jgi:hypothetical protein